MCVPPVLRIRRGVRDESQSAPVERLDGQPDANPLTHATPGVALDVKRIAWSGDQSPGAAPWPPRRSTASRDLVYALEGESITPSRVLSVVPRAALAHPRAMGRPTAADLGVDQQRDDMDNVCVVCTRRTRLRSAAYVQPTVNLSL